MITRILLPVVLCLLAACSGPSVRILDRPVAPSKLERLVAGSDHLSKESSATLKAEGLKRNHRRDPDAVIATLAIRYRDQPTTARRLALAEICADRADLLVGVNDARSLGYYLDTLQLTEGDALADAELGRESAGSILYNTAAVQVSRLMRDRNLRRLTTQGALRQYEVGIAEGDFLARLHEFDHVVPSDWLDFDGVDLAPVRATGFGAAMVGHVSRTPARLKQNPNMSESGHSLPLNARVSFSGSKAMLHLQDLSLRGRTTINGREVELAGDYTAALAFLYYDRKRKSRKIMATLRPDKFEDRIGLFSIEPFREDKIPLVIVHGLLATAEGWLPFVNQLRADPLVRERYQMVFFNYPSGLPIQESSAELRAALASYRDVHDPGRRNPRMREVVILGHSMGGILSNMQIRESRNSLERVLFESPIEELPLEEAKREELRKRLRFGANEDITRAIFMASPHRGSDLAANPIGQLGSWLIRLPFDLMDSVLGELAVVDALTDVAQDFVERPQSSVTSLRPDNPILAGTLALPVHPEVRIHSIMARANSSEPLVESSDRVVPYVSAQLDEDVSEVIVDDANHSSMVTRPETLREVWRILREHAGR